MTYARATWRLMLSPPARGAWNMAVDEAILEGVIAGKSPATLRLYAWEPPCLSLGYAQPFADVDFPTLQQHSWDIVRRPTGGRAILHTDELTYAVIGPGTDPRLAGSVLESYHNLAQALLLALQKLGCDPRAAADPPAAPGSDPKGPVCFEVPSHYEITVRHKKLVGSAQRRSKGGVLQHGSLPLHGDLGRITLGLRFPDPAARQEASMRLLERAATLENLLGVAIPWSQAAQAFRDAFSEALDLDLQPGVLTQTESELAQQLARDKYAGDPWTRRA
jgi:lipoyl(octanoyl) transferase